MAVISWNVLWVGGAVLGRMVGAGSGLPLAFQSFCHRKRPVSQR